MMRVDRHCVLHKSHEPYYYYYSIDLIDYMGRGFDQAKSGLLEEVDSEIYSSMGNRKGVIKLNLLLVYIAARIIIAHTSTFIKAVQVRLSSSQAAG